MKSNLLTNNETLEFAVIQQFYKQLNSYKFLNDIFKKLEITFLYCRLYVQDDLVLQIFYRQIDT